MTDLRDRMPPGEVRLLMRLVEWHVRRRFGRHRLVEEAVAEGFVGMWESLLKIEESRACQRTTAAVKGGVWKATSFIRGKNNDCRRESRRGVPIPALVSLDEVTEFLRPGDADGPQITLRRVVQEPGTPDHAEGVLDRLDYEELVQQLKGECSALEWEILSRTVMDDELAIDVAAELGLGYTDLLRRRAELIERLGAQGGKGVERSRERAA